MLKLVILFVFLTTTVLGGYEYSNQFPWWDTVRSQSSTVRSNEFLCLFRMIIKRIPDNPIKLSHFHNVCYPVPDRIISNHQICKTYLIKLFVMKNDMQKMNIMKTIERIMVKKNFLMDRLMIISLDDMMDDDDYDYRSDKGKARAAAAAAIKLTGTIMTKLACDLTGTDGDNL